MKQESSSLLILLTNDVPHTSLPYNSTGFTKKCSIDYLIFWQITCRINVWIISSMFHLMKTKQMLHKCQWDHNTEVQLSNDKDYNVASNNKCRDAANSRPNDQITIYNDYR
jgi:hypothetical protein